MKNQLFRGLMVGALALTVMTTAMPAPAAQAQTTNNQTIEQLIALIQQLQAQITAQTGGTNNTSAPATTLTRDLSQGMTGSDVLALQRFLNSDPDTLVALSGVGSKGSETTHFGPATRAAVIKFQNKYRAQVLTPSGLIAGTGYVGPATRAHINKLATVVTPPVTNPGNNSGDQDNQDDTDNDVVKEEGDITVTRGSEHVSTLELNSTDAVYSVDIKAEDSAMTIERFDIFFDKRPWRYLDSVTLYHDGDEVKTVKATESNFSEVGDEYRLRFSGLKEVVAKGKKESFVIEIKALNHISNSRQADTLSLYIPDDGIRAKDTAGLISYGPNNDLETRTFDFRDAENDGSLVVSRAANSPENGQLEVDSAKNTTNVPVMIANVRAKGNDIALSKLYVKVESSESTVTNVVRRLSIKHDGNTIATESVVKNGSSAITGKDEDGNSYTIIGANEYYVYFDDLEDIKIDEGDRTDFTLLAEFNRANGSQYSSGTTVAFTLRHLVGENESDEDVINGNLTIGDNRTFTLVTDGNSVALKDSSAVLTSSNNSSRGTFMIEFDVTPFGDDIYLLKGTGRQTSTSTIGGVGIEYSFENSAGAKYALGSTAGTISVKGAKEVGSFYRLSEGETYRTKLEVTLSNAAATEDVYRMQLEGLRYRIGSESGTLTTVTTGFTNYETKYLFLAD